DPRSLKEVTQLLAGIGGEPFRASEPAVGEPLGVRPAPGLVPERDRADRERAGDADSDGPLIEVVQRLGGALLELGCASVVVRGFVDGVRPPASQRLLGSPGVVVDLARERVVPLVPGDHGRPPMVRINTSTDSKPTTTARPGP